MDGNLLISISPLVLNVGMLFSAVPIALYCAPLTSYNFIIFPFASTAPPSTFLYVVPSPTSSMLNESFIISPPSVFAVSACHADPSQYFVVVQSSVFHNVT